MTPEEAKKRIHHEASDGIAYSSRMGDYSDEDNFSLLIEAIQTISNSLKGQETVERSLFSALFVIGNQVEGNVHGALSKGLTVPEWLWDKGIVDLNEALYEVFEGS